LQLTLCSIHADILEGNLTNSMQQKYDQAYKEVLQELHHTLACNGESRATAFMKYQSTALLSERVRCEFLIQGTTKIMLLGKNPKNCFCNCKKEEILVHCSQEHAATTGKLTAMHK